ncbi:MAG: D-glycero-beta-D-manno-heptose-7-phosphate kinase [Cyclobacteriaceae bacterium]|nr:D-glycero-beta-D-manno-heptose-7-phosphate kinase [Cyclobacteriaceae bacterium HetDA_MAG_MS6]
MHFKSVSDLLAAFRKLKVLVIGDVMIDTYIYGAVNRISPEAPVPIVNVHHKEQRLGGAANVALNIQSLGATPILCSITGDDKAGEDFHRLLHAENLPAHGIVRSGNRMTTIKTRVVSGSHQLMRIDEEQDQLLDALDRKTLLSHIHQLIADCDVIIFEDYDKGCLDEKVIMETISMARKYGIPTAVDPKSRNFLSYKHVNLFKPNLQELKAGLNVEFKGPDSAQLEEAASTLKKYLNCESILITLSKEGVFYMSKERSGSLPAQKRSVSDVSGAGDTVISIAALGLAMNLPIGLVAKLANLGGGIVCEYPGVVPISLDRLEKEAEASAILGEFT